MKRPEKGRLLFYTRDSGGGHETTPGEYIRRAQAKANALGLAFDGTPEVIEAMMKDGRAVVGDIFLDYDVRGSELSRPALDALMDTAKKNRKVTHIFIPRRDRLARPKDPLAGIEIENKLRRMGITLLIRDDILGPLRRGAQLDIGELIKGAIDYHQSGGENFILAEKILNSQLALARAGYSTGGRPPLGFERWLVSADGTDRRKLQDKEHVRLPGYHVVWLPTNEAALQLAFRIIEMLETMPASRIALKLTAEGIPSPLAGTYRYCKKTGITRMVSGFWHSNMVTNIGRNKLLVALKTYGSRSMGDHGRFSLEGPRRLSEETDYRDDGSEKEKVITNEHYVTVKALFLEPQIELKRFEQLQATLDKRGESQRGKPRSHDPDKNPLGARIFDLNCTWTMYRVAEKNGRFRYNCSQYIQSHGQQCSSNRVDGMQATRFALGAIQQRVFAPMVLSKLKEKLLALAQRDLNASRFEHSAKSLQAALAKVTTELDTASRNLGFAANQDQYQAVSKIFDTLTAQRKQLEIDLATASPQPLPDVDSQVRDALLVAGRLRELAEDENNLASIGELFRSINVRLFLKFAPKKLTKRVVNRVVSGSVAIGAAPSPIEVYQGRTAREYVKASSAAENAADPGLLVGSPGNFPSVTGKGKSIRNVNRGDKI
jgi:hypothetical protein